MGGLRPASQPMHSVSMLTPDAAAPLITDAALLISDATALLLELGSDVPLATAPLLEFSFADVPLQGGIFPGLLLLMTATSLFASCFGFGDGVIAIPMMALLFGIDAPQAAPLQTVVSSALGVLILLVDILDGKINQIGRWRESLALFMAAAVGVPLGVNALVTLDVGLLRAAVGAILIGYGGWALSTDDDDLEAVEEAKAAANMWPPPRVLPFGLAAGSLCGAVGEPGPLAIVYGSTRKWDAPTMRGMLARFFLPVQLVTLNEFAGRGLLGEPILIQSVATLPFALLAVVIGTRLNRSFDPARFQTAVDAIVVALGGLCVYTGVVGV